MNIPRPFFIFRFRRDGFFYFFPNIPKSEFGGFEKQEIKLSWTYYIIFLLYLLYILNFVKSIETAV